MGLKLALAAILTFSLTQNANATIIEVVNGNYYSIIQSTGSSDSNGKNDSTFDQSPIDNTPFTHQFSFDKDSLINQSVVIESGSFGDATSQQEWNRGIYRAESAAPNTPFTSSLLSMVDTTQYDVTESIELWAINSVTTDLINNTTTYRQRLNFSYALSGFSSDDSQGVNTSNSFTYFLNIFLNLDTPLTASDVLGVDANTVDTMLRAHQGRSLTITEGISVDTFVSNNLGDFTSDGFSTMFLGDGTLEVSVPEPRLYTLIVAAFLGLIRIRSHQ